MIRTKKTRKYNWDHLENYFYYIFILFIKLSSLELSFRGLNQMFWNGLWWLNLKTETGRLVISSISNSSSRIIMNCFIE